MDVGPTHPRTLANSRGFARNVSSVNLDAREELLEADNVARVHTGNIKLLTKFVIATLSSLGLSVSLYILIPSIPTYLSANLIPAISTLQPTPTASDKTLIQAPPDRQTSTYKSPIQTKLQNIALNIIQNNDWNAQKLHYFKLTWQGLKQNEKTALQETVWFQMFERALSLQVNTTLRGLSDDTETYSPQEHALLALAIDLDILRSNNRNRSRSPSKNNRDLPKSAKIASKESKMSRRTNKAPVVSNTPKVASLKKAETNQIASTTNVVTRESMAQQAPLKKSLRKTPLARPSYSELSDITVQFVDAYEAGNLEKFTALFTNNAISNNQNNRKDIKKQYAKLFSSTTERQMFIHDMKWTFKKNAAIGKGVLELVVLSSNQADVITQKGRVQLVAEKQNNKVLIKRFYHLSE